MNCWSHRAWLIPVLVFLLMPCTSSGPAGVRAAEAKGADSQGLPAGLKIPPGFVATLFASPPEVHYPTCLTAAPTGELFVGVDENGSLDAKPGRGRVLRCIDTNNDGKADRINVFAEMDSPRGLVYDAGTLYVLHPPDLTAYHDENGDGKADRSETLVKGIGFDLSFRGADHTTNGIQLGIDGWLYIAVGDYGFLKAIGTDGMERRMRGGGVARVRTDGTGLELYSRGQRNIYDVAIDPYLNLFTRDNTNDGGGWDVRLSHVISSGHYGYPLLFSHFGDEIVPPLADYGGGSPTGSLYVQEPGLPSGFNDTLYTCDWGRGVVYRHPLEPAGAGFKAGQEPFVTISRPTDMDVDGQGRIYLSSWNGGQFTYAGPDIGYVVRLTYPGKTAPAFPDLKAASDAELLDYLHSPSAILRLHAQRAVVRRGENPALASGLEAIARDHSASRASRAAAIFTLEQLLGRRSIAALISLAKEAAVREFALRALGDRTGEAAAVPARPFMDALADRDPRVRLQAAAALGRLGKAEAAAAVTPLLADPDPLVAHVAVQSLVTFRAADACLKALDPSTLQLVPGAVKVLERLHETRVVDGLVARVGPPGDSAIRRAALKALCRLYQREAEWDGKWWGTRPDTSGPYFKPETWEGSATIRRVLVDELRRGDESTLRLLLPELIRNKVDFEEATGRALELARRDPAIRAEAVALFSGRPNLPAEAVAFLASVARSDRDDPALRARALRGLQRVGRPNALAARDALVDALANVGAAADPPTDLQAVWQDFVRDGRHSREADAFVALAEGPDRARGALAYAVLLQLGDGGRRGVEARAAASRAIERAWNAPESAARLLEAIGRTRSEAHAGQVRARLGDADADVRRAAADAAHRLGLDRADAPRGPTIAQIGFDRAVVSVQREKGDAKVGAALFQKQGCVSCHTTSKSEPLKGPFLGDIANRYSRAELAESILRPSARLAQGFETQKLATTSGQVVEGFVVRESGDEVELRNAAGAVTVIPKTDIEERATSNVSVMPNGLADALTVSELASILTYLDELRAAQ